MTTKIKEIELEGKSLKRNIIIDRSAVDGEKRTLELSFSSEEPYERWFGTEILDHKSASIRLGRLKQAGPLLLNHDSRDQIGVIESVKIGEDRKGRAVVRFGKGARAEEIFQDVKDGIRQNVSVGYMIHKLVLEEEKKDEPDIYRATDWEPMEISIVSVPADTTVGVGRSDNNKEEIQPERKEENMKFKQFLDPDKTGNESGGTATFSPEEKTQIREEARKDAFEKEQHRIREITAIGQQFKLEEIARKFIQDGKSADEFRQAVLEQIGAKPVTDPNPEIGLSEKQAKEFSILKAMRSVLETGNLSKAPFEKECSDEVRKKYKLDECEANRFSVPFEVSKVNLLREMTAGVPADGGHLVDTTLMSGSLIELLRNMPLVSQMGSTVFNGLVGDIAIPRQISGATAYWLPESTDITAASQAAFDQLGMTPKHVGAYTEISRQLMLQSSIDIEAFVRQELAKVVALEVDRVSIDGGAANEPTGILNTSGIGAVVAGNPDGGPPTWQNVVDLETEVAIDNALLGNLGYLTNASMRGKLKTTEKATNTGIFLMGEGNGGPFSQLNGYRAGFTNQIPGNLTKGAGTNLSAMIFGNWADLIQGYWGAVDILVDPFTKSLSGGIRVIIFRSMDLAIRHPESFSAVTDYSTN